MNTEPSTEQARKDIEFIKSMIQEGRSLLIENGSAFIIWGIAIPIGTACSYLLPLVTRSPLAFAALWAGILLIGFAAFFLIMRGTPRSMMNASYAGKIHGMTWLGATAAMTVTGIGYFFGKMGLNAFIGVIAGVIGCAYLVSGAITRYRWLIALSFAWWIGGIACFFMPAYTAPAVLAGMVVLLELLPGIVAFSRLKKASRAD